MIDVDEQFENYEKEQYKKKVIDTGYKYKTEDELRAIHREAIEEFGDVYLSQQDIRRQCLDDRRFCYIRGAQYDGISQMFDNKPMFELNKTGVHVKRLLSDFRKNVVEVSFISESRESRDNEFAQDLYRADSQTTEARDSIVSAVEESFAGGMGAVELLHDYDDPSSDCDDKMRIKYSMINDADQSVFYDSAAKLSNKSDAVRCWKLTQMTQLDYKREYSAANISTWAQIAKTISSYEWANNKTVVICDYYKVVNVKDKVLFFSNGLNERRYRESELKADPEITNELKIIGYEEVKNKSKKIYVKKVEHYILSGEKVIEECGYVPGDRIPIIPMYALRSVINGIEHIAGHVRMARDPQIIKNVMASMLGQIAYTSPQEKPIFTAEQIVGHEYAWQNDAVDNNAFLTINSIKNIDGSIVPAGPVGYTKPASVPPALAALIQVAEQDLGDILGQQKELDKAPANMSGVAYELMQNRLDAVSYIMFDNAANFIKSIAECWLGMAKEVYVEEGREIQTIGSSDEAKFEKIGEWKKDGKGGGYKANILSNNKFHVKAVVGPASQSKKQAAVKDLRESAMATDDPEIKRVLAMASLWNYSGDGASDLNEYARKGLVKMGVLTPTDDDKEQAAQEQANTQPDPNAVYLEAAAQEALAKAEKAKADSMLVIARAEETRAKTDETLSTMDLDQRRHTIETAEKLANTIKGNVNG